MDQMFHVLNALIRLNFPAQFVSYALAVCRAIGPKADFKKYLINNKLY